jgi:plastocyanin
MSSAVLGAAVGGAAAPESGAVSGSITIEQAYIRSEGPKHDRDVVVMLEDVDRKAPVTSGSRATMDQSGLVFVPHVLAVPVGATVTFSNSDNEQHNVYFLDDATGDTLDIGTWGPGVSVDHAFEKPGMVITLCKLHLEMAAYVVVSPSPWFDHVEVESADASTRFEIDGVPPGNYLLSVWHKKLKQKGGAIPIKVRDGTAVEVNVVLTQARFARSSR